MPRYLSMDPSAGTPINGGPYLSTNPDEGQAPTFRQEVVGQLSEAAKTFGQDVNPVQIGQLLPWPQSLGGSGLNNPLLPSNILRQMQGVKQEGDARWNKGDHVGALAKYAESLIPILGPGMSQLGNELQSGEYGKAAGHVAAAVATAKVPDILASIPEWRAARQAASATKATSQQMSDLMKAIPPTTRAPYDSATVLRARPYLEAEHAQAPISSVIDLRDAADSAITEIEGHVGQAIAANPNDLIRTKPLAAVRAKLATSVRASDVNAAVNELSDLHLDQPTTVSKADAIRLRLNAENKATLKRNNYDVATAREVDPAFTAREVAANSLRDGIYSQLEARGIAGIDELRRDEGALIQVRNASERQVFSGEKQVGRTGTSGPMRRMVSRGITLGGTGLGATVAGPAGAVAGNVLGQEAAALVNAPNLTRDALVARAFSRGSSARPVYPTIPESPPIAGLIGSGPIITPPPPDTSFVRGIPAQPMMRVPAGQLGRGAIPMGSGQDMSGGAGIPARGLVIRDARTGRFRRIFTTEPREP